MYIHQELDARDLQTFDYKEKSCFQGHQNAYQNELIDYYMLVFYKSLLRLAHILDEFFFEKDPRGARARMKRRP